MLQELVDDNLIYLEKIGAANYYWGFLSEINKTSTERKQRLEEADAAASAEIANLTEAVRVAQAKRTRSDRVAVLKEVEALSEEAKTWV